jgi:hypothetical protein
MDSERTLQGRSCCQWVMSVALLPDETHSVWPEIGQRPGSFHVLRVLKLTLPWSVSTKDISDLFHALPIHELTLL